MPKQSRPPRAARGSASGQFNIRWDRQLANAVKMAAESTGLNASAWLRSAAIEKLGRQWAGLTGKAPTA